MQCKWSGITHHNRFDVERTFALYVSECLAQGVDVAFIIEQVSPTFRHQGEEERTARDQYVSISHLGSFVGLRCANPTYP
jgi:hypothetical protein